MIRLTATLLGRHIDRYVTKAVPHYEPNFLERTVEEGKDHIGRVLHYYPMESKLAVEDDWCGWHNDHSCLTGLMPAAFYDGQGHRVKPTGTDGGLYAITRDGQQTRIQIPEDCIAFQSGETLQIMSGNAVEATPHSVMSFADLVGKDVTRETMAVFYQPGPGLVMRVPEGRDREKTLASKPMIPELRPRFEDGMTFADFSVRTIQSYS